jgi:hypothetical protein
VEARWEAKLLRVKRTGLEGRFLPGCMVPILIFGEALSARSSFRIEFTRISQMRCLESDLLLLYSRLRSSPFTPICSQSLCCRAVSRSH